VPEITVGILASKEAADLLRGQVHATGLARVAIETGEYCAAMSDRLTRRLIECAPNIIIIDIEQHTPALQSLSLLHSELPEAWIFVSSPSNDPQLIIESMRAGAREFLPKPVTKEHLQQAIRRYMAEGQKSKKGSARMYCVTSAKCGVGTTSVAINSAVALGSVPDVRPALLDLRAPLGDVSAFLNLKPQFTLDDALSASSRLDSALLDSYTTAVHGVSVLAGTANYHPGRKLPVAELDRILGVAADTYSHCFFDLAMSADEDCLRLAAELSSLILLVVTPDLPAIWRTERLLRFLQENNYTEKIRLIVNRSRKADEIRDTEIKEAVNHSVFWKLPDDHETCIDAINSGKPVALGDNSGLSRSYRRMVSRLTGITLPEKRRSLLNFFS
jgi:pilus assembly protein CpaE